MTLFVDERRQGHEDLRLLKRIVVVTDGIVDAPVASGVPVRDVGEQRPKAWPGCIRFSAQDVGIEWRFGASRFRLFDERVVAEQASGTQFLADTDSACLPGASGSGPAITHHPC